MANANWQAYQQHLKVGFEPEQAMQIICTMMQALVSTKIMLGDDGD